MKRPFLILLAASSTLSAEAWKKHVIAENGLCLTALAADFNGDGKMDVIAGSPGRITLFTAPDWKETTIKKFREKKTACIHSEVLDIDGDGDPDFIGADANDHPFWLENPSGGSKRWKERDIDKQLTGIHCILKADVDGNGKPDLIINNFLPDGPLGNSIAWFSIPENPLKAKVWDRHVFADGDAPGGSHYFGFGDLDGDGHGEIAVGAKGKPFKDGDWFAFWKNPGKDNITKPWTKVLLAEDQIGATNILPGDVDGDGQVDLVASRGHGAGVIWFKGPEWTIQEIDPELKSPHSLTLADHDGDGDLDAASCGFQSKKLMWYENDGKGNFTLHQLDDNQESYDLRSVDMDGDGDLDLLNAGRATGNVAWYENPGS